MADKKPERQDYATKQATGSLFRAVTLSTDPGQTLMFSSSLISVTRAALIQKLEDKCPDYDQIPILMNTILKKVALEWAESGSLNPEALDEMEKRIDSIFKSESMMRYDLEIYRDIVYCDDALAHWRTANETYTKNHSAWSISNSILSQVHRMILEIIVRHNLMQFPRGEIFSVDDQGLNMSRIAKALQEGGS